MEDKRDKVGEANEEENNDKEKKKKDEKSRVDNTDRMLSEMIERKMKEIEEETFLLNPFDLLMAAKAPLSLMQLSRALFHHLFDPNSIKSGSKKKGKSSAKLEQIGKVLRLYPEELKQKIVGLLSEKKWTQASQLSKDMEIDFGFSDKETIEQLEKKVEYEDVKLNDTDKQIKLSGKMTGKKETAKGNDKEKTGNVKEKKGKQTSISKANVNVEEEKKRLQSKLSSSLAHLIFEKINSGNRMEQGNMGSKKIKIEPGTQGEAEGEGEVELSDSEIYLPEYAHQFLSFVFVPPVCKTAKKTLDYLVKSVPVERRYPAWCLYVAVGFEETLPISVLKGQTDRYEVKWLSTKTKGNSSKSIKQGFMDELLEIIRQENVNEKRTSGENNRKTTHRLIVSTSEYIDKLTQHFCGKYAIEFSRKKVVSSRNVDSDDEDEEEKEKDVMSEKKNGREQIAVTVDMIRDDPYPKINPNVTLGSSSKKKKEDSEQRDTGGIFKGFRMPDEMRKHFDEKFQALIKKRS